MITVKKGQTIEKFKELPLTYTLIIVNSLLFLLTTVPSLTNFLYHKGELHGYGVLYMGEWYRLFSSMFLHNGATHILFNMVSLYMLGRIMERLFSFSAYILLYFVTGVMGGLFFIYFSPNGSAVGASGAVFGLFGALAGFAFVHRKTHRTAFIDFMKQFGVILLLNFLLGMVFENIAMSAHVGGLLSGIILGLAIAKYPKFLWLHTLLSLMLIMASYSYLWNLYLA